MRYYKIIILSITFLLALASTAAYLMPLDAYVPRVEQTLSSQVHEPLTIRHLRIAVLPMLQLELQEVHLGGTEGIAARKIIVRPDLRSLLAGEVVVRQILVQDGTAHLAMLQKLAELFGGAPKAVHNVSLRQLQLSGMSLVASGMALGTVEAKVDFAVNGSLERVWLAMDGKKMTMTLLPLAEQHFAVVVKARDWILPQFPGFPKVSALCPNELHIEGVLGLKQLVVEKLTASVSGIHLEAKGRLDYTKGWEISATLNKLDVQLETLMQMWAKPLGVAGEFSATGEFSSKGANMQALKDNSRFAGNLRIRNATLARGGEASA